MTVARVRSQVVSNEIVPRGESENSRGRIQAFVSRQLANADFWWNHRSFPLSAVFQPWRFSHITALQAIQDGDQTTLKILLTTGLPSTYDLAQETIKETNFEAFKLLVDKGNFFDDKEKLESLYKYFKEEILSKCFGSKDPQLSDSQVSGIWYVFMLRGVEDLKTMRKIYYSSDVRNLIFGTLSIDVPRDVMDIIRDFIV